MSRANSAASAACGGVDSTMAREIPRRSSSSATFARAPRPKITRAGLASKTNCIGVCTRGASRVPGELHARTRLAPRIPRSLERNGLVRRFAFANEIGHFRRTVFPHQKHGTLGGKSLMTNVRRHAGYVARLLANHGLG